jgi:hypothetical protein
VMKRKLGVWTKLKLLYHYFKKDDMGLREFAIGMSSEIDIDRDLHILIMDYDEADENEVTESVKECQKFWNLSDCFIYKTRNGYHAYFFYDHMPYTRVRQIIDFAKYVDDKYRFISRYYDYKTIRVAGKYKERDISFVKCVSGARQPTENELMRGDLKRKERGILCKTADMLQKDNLKI